MESNSFFERVLRDEYIGDELFGALVLVGKLSLHKELVDQYRKILSLEEIEQAKTFRFQIDSDRFVVRRGLLRLQLAELIGILPSDIRYAYGTSGKPFLADYPHIFFNTSHSENLFALSISETAETGIDIESVKMIDFEDMIGQYFDTIEQEEILRSGGRESLERFYEYWTTKEAMLKSYGRSVADIDAIRVLKRNDGETWSEAMCKNKKMKIYRYDGDGYKCAVVMVDK